MSNGTPAPRDGAAVPLTDGVRQLTLTLPVVVVESEPEFGGEGWTLTAMVAARNHDATVRELRRAADALESVGPIMRRELYRLYLASPRWAEQRAAALERAGHKCQLCSSHTTNLQVHHNTYDRIGVELNTDLIVLCDDCHRKHHGIA
jgi:hypothetical protein